MSFVCLQNLMYNINIIGERKIQNERRNKWVQRFKNS